MLSSQEGEKKVRNIEFLPKQKERKTWRKKERMKERHESQTGPNYGVQKGEMNNIKYKDS